MLTYTDGQPCTGRITHSDRAREPRSLAVVAWYDGWGQASGMRAYTYPRRLDTFEVQSWREGWAEGKAAGAAWDARMDEVA
jgi:hypothetical protein